MTHIAKLKLPEFSGLSFVSKVRMFLDPINYAVLDLQLLKLRKQQTHTIFHEITAKDDPSTIRVTKHNEAIYERWSDQCRRVATQYFIGTGVRAVEIERGIFQLTNTNQAHVATAILVNA